MFARGVNVNLTPLTSKRGALATDARGCSLLRGNPGFATCSALDTSLDCADPGGGVTYTTLYGRHDISYTPLSYLEIHTAYGYKQEVQYYRINFDGNQ